jgi:hypothetical protein
MSPRVRNFWQLVLRLIRIKKISITVIVVIAISVGGFFLARFYDYMQHDPEFCNSCHLMEESWDRWATSKHQEIECHACHQQGLVENAQVMFSFITGSYKGVEMHAEVPKDACMECHESNDPQWIQVAATAGHQNHVENNNIMCTECHSTSLHRFVPQETLCIACHEDIHIESEGMATMHCTSCHKYLVEEDELTPHRKDCLDCHQALTESTISWPINAPMQYPCGDCHLPHQESELVVKCTQCHATREGMHLEGAHYDASCETCHKPHEWTVTQRGTCLTCHPGKTDHMAETSCNTCHTFN